MITYKEFKKSIKDYLKLEKIKYSAELIALQASEDISKLLLADVRKRTIIDKLKYFFICKNIGHKVSSAHRLYPSKYCSACNKHRSQF